MYSWIFALTLTPLFCLWLLPEGKGEVAKEEKEGAFFRGYKVFLARMVAARSWVLLATVGLFLVALWGFESVK